MTNQTAIITGASTGIGKAIAKHFLNQGLNLILNSSNQSKLEAAYDELGSPYNVHLVSGDISKQATGAELVETAISKYGSIDVLVNNAGVFQPKQAVIQNMLKQTEGGSIINIGTVLVDHAISGFPSTAPLTSKGGIHALTRQLAAEFGKNNIRINTIAPGIIRSPLQGKIGVEDADSLAGLHLLDRIGEAHEVAEAAYYLTTAKFVTGETLNVAGGHTVGHAI